MSLITYSAVIRDDTIIASIGELPNFSEKDIVKLAPATKSTEQKITGGYLISYVSTYTLTFVCVGQQSSDKQKCLTFLDSLSRRWYASFGPASTNATSHSMDGVMSENFGKLFEEFNKTPDQAEEINRTLSETEQLLTESMAKAIDRGNDLESISSRTEDLLSTSEEFRATATNLRWTMRCAWIKSWALWILFLIIIVYILLSWLCGGFRLKKCI